MPMEESTANEFFELLSEGTDHYKTIEVEHGSGRVLKNVEMHPVDKKTLAFVIQSLPDEMFTALEEADDADEASEMLGDDEDTASLAAMSEDTVEAFERLVTESLRHDEANSVQMRKFVESLDFITLFELGGEIIDLSFSSNNAIKGFREQG